MLLRILLGLIKPSNEQLRCKKAGKFVRLKILLYQFLLRRVLKTYLHYAISDTIVVDKGKIKIVHEFRDLGFESELLRNKIDFKSEMISISAPISMRKSKMVGYFTCFKFKDVLSVYVDGKELFVKHDEKYSIDGTVKGKFKASVIENKFQQSLIEILTQVKRVQEVITTNHQPISPNKTDKTPPKQKDRTNKRPKNIFERDRDIITIIPKTEPKTNVEDDKNINSPNIKIIEKKGFEIDTSF